MHHIFSLKGTAFVMLMFYLVEFVKVLLLVRAE